MAERHVLDLGDRGVELAHLGRGHTDNDLVVSVPGAGVVYAGDLLEESAPPAYGDDCFPLDWPGTADALVARAPTTFVPGHGDVMGLAAAAEQATAIAAVAERDPCPPRGGRPAGRRAGRGQRSVAVPAGRAARGRGPGLRRARLTARAAGPPP